MELDMDDNYMIIERMTDTILNTFRITFPDTDDRDDYYRYLNKILNKIKKPNNIPHYLIDKYVYTSRLLESAQDELNRLRSSSVRGDSFGDGMPHGSSDPNSTSDLHKKIIELDNETIPNYRKDLDDVKHRIDLYDLKLDAEIIKPIECFIELLPNEKHKNVVMQFYIYRKSYGKISNDSYISDETAKDYRKRGFNELVDILYNFSKKVY